MLQKLLHYARLMRLHRPIGIWLLLWPTLWAVWIASSGKPNIKILSIFILGTIVMRSAGCVINDFADRKFDGQVARTRDRPLVTGMVTAKEAIGLFIILCFLALLLVLQLNFFTIKLAVIGLLLAIIYPFTKRITYWPQLVLGAAFAWAVPMAFAAQQNHLSPITWLLYVIAVLWPLTYDTMYAMVDREDDRKIGIKSTALLFAQHDRLVIGILQIIILSLLIVIGAWLKLNSYYYGCLFIAAGLFIYQQYLLKQPDTQHYFRAFKNNNWFGAVVFVGFVLGTL